MWAVWTKDAIDEDRWVLGGLTGAQADSLVRSLEGIYVGIPVWMEEE